MSQSNLKILAYEETALGWLCLRRRELLSRPGTIVTEVTINHEFLMSSYITASERALSRIALELHQGDELSVLIGGLGLGYTAMEALTVGGSRVKKVDVVEYLPEVIGWVKRGLVPLSSELQADPRLSMLEDDVYRRLAGTPDRAYDIIVIDVDHSPEEHLGRENSSFYSANGLRQAKKHLAPGGILGVWSYARHSPFAVALTEVFEDVRVEPITAWNDLVDEEHTDWLFFARG